MLQQCLAGADRCVTVLGPWSLFDDQQPLLRTPAKPVALNEQLGSVQLLQPDVTFEQDLFAIIHHQRQPGLNPEGGFAVAEEHTNGLSCAHKSPAELVPRFGTVEAPVHQPLLVLLLKLECTKDKGRCLRCGIRAGSRAPRQQSETNGKGASQRSAHLNERCHSGDSSSRRCITGSGLGSGDPGSSLPQIS